MLPSRPKTVFNECENLPLLLTTKIIVKCRHIVLPSVNTPKNLLVSVTTPKIGRCQICGFKFFEASNPSIAFTVGTMTPRTQSCVIVLNFRAIPGTWVNCATKPDQPTHTANKHQNDDEHMSKHSSTSQSAKS